MLLVLFGVSTFVFAFAILAVFGQLAQFRTDIKRGESPGDGTSPFWQVNVMNTANYTQDGRRLLRRLRWLRLAFAVSLIGVLSQVWRLQANV